MHATATIRSILARPLAEHNRPIRAEPRRRPFGAIERKQPGYQPAATWGRAITGRADSNFVKENSRTDSPNDTATQNEHLIIEMSTTELKVSL